MGNWGYLVSPAQSMLELAELSPLLALFVVVHGRELVAENQHGQ